MAECEEPVAGVGRNRPAVFIKDIDRINAVAVTQFLQHCRMIHGLQAVAFIIRQVDPVAVVIISTVIPASLFIQDIRHFFHDKGKQPGCGEEMLIIVSAERIPVFHAFFISAGDFLQGRCRLLHTLCHFQQGLGIVRYAVHDHDADQHQREYFPEHRLVKIDRVGGILPQDHPVGCHGMADEVIADNNGIGQGYQHHNMETHDGPEQHKPVIRHDLVCSRRGTDHRLVIEDPGNTVILLPLDCFNTAVAVRQRIAGQAALQGIPPRQHVLTVIEVQEQAVCFINRKQESVIDHCGPPQHGRHIPQRTGLRIQHRGIHPDNQGIFFIPEIVRPGIEPEGSEPIPDLDRLHRTIGFIGILQQAVYVFLGQDTRHCRVDPEILPVRTDHDTAVPVQDKQIVHPGPFSCFLHDLGPDVLVSCHHRFREAAGQHQFDIIQNLLAPPVIYFFQSFCAFFVALQGCQRLVQRQLAVFILPPERCLGLHTAQQVTDQQRAKHNQNHVERYFGKEVCIGFFSHLPGMGCRSLFRHITPFKKCLNFSGYFYNTQRNRLR